MTSFGPDEMEAQFDQVSASVRTLAVLLSLYYQSLKSSGFNDDQSFKLARDYELVYFQKSFGVRFYPF